MKIHKLVQGSPEWDHFRLTHKGASEIAAALGISPTTKRTELLQVKRTGIAKEFSEFVQTRVLDKGHEVEALARPIVEELIGEDLYPVTCSNEDVGGDLSASCDGLTMARKIAMEHKQWAEDLAAQVAAGIVPEHHMAQCQQILLVTRAEKVIFVVSDGTREKFVQTTVTPDDAWFERIERGWEQFDADLADFELVEIKERPKADVSLALPALVIHAVGEITTSNMKEYGVALAQRLAEVRSIALVTDQDFSNAKAGARLLREEIQKAALVKAAMLEQTLTVGEAARMIDTWCEDMRITALQLEKDVEREDKAKKAAMVLKSREAYETYVEALKQETGGPWIALVAPDWAAALKNKRSFASMQDALDTMLANAKITANDSARKIRAALACMDEEAKGYEFLMADRLSLIGKPVEDIRIIVRSRITEHKRKEDERLEAERVKLQRDMAMQEIQGIQQQVAIAISGRLGVRKGGTVECIRETLAETEGWTITEERFGALVGAAQAAKNKAVAEIQQLLVNAKAKAAIATAATPAQAPAPAAAASASAPVTAPVVQPGKLHPAAAWPFPRPGDPAPVAEEKPTLKLGDICERLRFNVTADFLAELGFIAHVERSAKLYRPSLFPAICEALIQHLTTVADEVAA